MTGGGLYSQRRASGAAAAAAAAVLVSYASSLRYTRRQLLIPAAAVAIGTLTSYVCTVTSSCVVHCRLFLSIVVTCTLLCRLPSRYL